MEKFFIIPKEHDFYKEFTEFSAFETIKDKLFKQFKDRSGIESTRFVCHGDLLAIVPTRQDRAAFGDQLRTHRNSDGSVFFKKHTQIGHIWVDIVNGSGYANSTMSHRLRDPSLYVTGQVLILGAKTMQDLFMLDETLYYSLFFDRPFRNYSNFEEIASFDFHNAYERYKSEKTTRISE